MRPCTLLKSLKCGPKCGAYGHILRMDDLGRYEVKFFGYAHTIMIPARFIKIEEY